MTEHVHILWDEGVVTHSLLAQLAPQKTVKTFCGKRVPFHRAATPDAATKLANCCPACRARNEQKIKDLAYLEQVMVDLKKAGRI
jgi:hypothetical protein